MKKNNQKVVICGNYGIGNLGDEGILAGIIRLVNSALPSAKISVFSSNIKQTEKYFGVKAISFFPAGVRSSLKFWFLGGFWKTFGEVGGADLVILGGGGLFSDEKPAAVWIWFVQAFWLMLLRKKLFCLGQSVGPVKTWWGKWLTGLVFKYAKAVTVRDRQSKELLESLGVKNVVVLADPAYAIGYDIDSFHQQSDYVVMTLRPWIKGDHQKISGELAKCVDWLYEAHKLKTVFIPFQKDGESDVVRYDELEALVKDKKALILHEAEIDYVQSLEMIARAKLVLGMRLHSIIFAVLTKTPFLALSYSKKVKDFVGTLGMDSYLEYDKIELRDLKESIEVILGDREKIVQALEKQKLHFTYVVFKHEEMIKGVAGQERK